MSYSCNYSGYIDSTLSKTGSNRFNTGSINIYLFSRVYRPGTCNALGGFGKEALPGALAMARFAPAAPGERRQRAAGQRRGSAGGMGVWHRHCLSAQDPGNPRDYGELAPGRRAMCFVSLLVSLSALGSLERAAQSSTWSRHHPSAPHSPPGASPHGGAAWHPSRGKPGHGLSHPRAAAGRALAAVGQKVPLLCPRQPVLSVFHLLRSLPPSALFGSFSVRLQGRLAGEHKVLSQCLADTWFESFWRSPSLSETHSGGKRPSIVILDGSRGPAPASAPSWDTWAIVQEERAR